MERRWRHPSFFPGDRESGGARVDRGGHMFPGAIGVGRRKAPQKVFLTSSLTEALMKNSGNYDRVEKGGVRR